jgi:hypothetical protein
MILSLVAVWSGGTILTIGGKPHGSPCARSSVIRSPLEGARLVGNSLTNNQVFGEQAGGGAEPAIEEPPSLHGLLPY